MFYKKNFSPRNKLAIRQPSALIPSLKTQWTSVVEIFRFRYNNFVWLKKSCYTLQLRPIVYTHFITCHRLNFFKHLKKRITLLTYLLPCLAARVPIASSRRRHSVVWMLLERQEHWPWCDRTEQLTLTRQRAPLTGEFSTCISRML